MTRQVESIWAAMQVPFPQPKVLRLWSSDLKAPIVLSPTVEGFFVSGLAEPIFIYQVKSLAGYILFCRHALLYPPSLKFGYLYLINGMIELGVALLYLLNSAVAHQRSRHTAVHV